VFIVAVQTDVVSPDLQLRKPRAPLHTVTTGRHARYGIRRRYGRLNLKAAAPNGRRSIVLAYSARCDRALRPE
jgi:hypothetical protein